MNRIEHMIQAKATELQTELDRQAGQYSDRSAFTPPADAAEDSRQRKNWNNNQWNNSQQWSNR